METKSDSLAEVVVHDPALAASELSTDSESDRQLPVVPVRNLDCAPCLRPRHKARDIVQSLLGRDVTSIVLQYLETTAVKVGTELLRACEDMRDEAPRPLCWLKYDVTELQVDKQLVEMEQTCWYDAGNFVAPMHCVEHIDSPLLSVDTADPILLPEWPAEIKSMPRPEFIGSRAQALWVVALWALVIALVVFAIPIGIAAEKSPLIGCNDVRKSLVLFSGLITTPLSTPILLSRLQRDEPGAPGQLCCVRCSMLVVAPCATALLIWSYISQCAENMCFYYAREALASALLLCAIAECVSWVTISRPLFAARRARRRCQQALMAELQQSAANLE